MSTILDEISLAWEMEGFLGLLRDQEFDEKKGEFFLQRLKLVNFNNEDKIPKNIVSFLWYIPLFMEWQSAKLESIIVAEKFNKYVNLQSQILVELERILGIP